MMQVEYCAAVKEGRAAIVTNEIEQLLGRPPRGYAAWGASTPAPFFKKEKNHD